MNRGEPSMMSDSRGLPSSGAWSPALAIEETQRKQRKERRAPAEVLTILAIEGTGVEIGVGSGVVSLGAARAAATLTAPVHRVAPAREAEAMAKQATAEHRGRGYSGVASRERER